MRQNFEAELSMTDVTTEQADGSDAANDSLDIAIVGMYGRFPEMHEGDEYWVTWRLL